VQRCDDERGEDATTVYLYYIYIYYIHTAGGGKTDANLCNKFPGRFVYIIIICIPLHTYTIRVYNGQSGDINNANGGSTSRSNLAEDVVKVYIVRCVLIYTRRRLTYPTRLVTRHHLHGRACRRRRINCVT